MNIHPILVHFPIALLSLYSILEILQLPIITRQSYYFFVKATLVIVGALATIPTLIAGDMAKEAYKGSMPQNVIEIHATFAIIATIYFLIIALFYFVGWLRRTGFSKFTNLGTSGFWYDIVWLEKTITEGVFGIIVGLIGIALISTVGALGGLVAYGPDNDPVSALLYSIIMKK